MPADRISLHPRIINLKEKYMKKYVVMRVYGTLNPTVLFACDSEDDAKQYATIMSHQDDYVYSVAEVVFTIGG